MTVHSVYIGVPNISFVQNIMNYVVIHTYESRVPLFTSNLSVSSCLDDNPYVYKSTSPIQNFQHYAFFQVLSPLKMIISDTANKFGNISCVTKLLGYILTHHGI